MHYQRMKRGQQLDGTTRYGRRPAIIEESFAKIPLGIEAKHGYTIVDLEFSYLDKYNWTKGTRGYPTTHIDGKNVYLHHLIIGKPQPGFIVDHEDRDKQNNRLSNLRFTTQHTNAINKAIQKNNTSGHVGVTYNTKRKKWIAQIHYKGKNKFLGHFTTMEEAIEARRLAVENNPHFVEAMNLQN